MDYVENSYNNVHITLYTCYFNKTKTIKSFVLNSNKFLSK